MLTRELKKCPHTTEFHGTQDGTCSFVRRQVTIQESMKTEKG